MFTNNFSSYNLNFSVFNDFYRNKNILITGGTGTMGKILLKKLSDIECNITIFSRDEFKQWELSKQFPNAKYIIGDIRDLNSCIKSLKNIDIVFHTAALKHVNIIEENLEECIKTNINGTLNITEASLISSVKYFITLSTDKSCLPTNFYGSSKYISERITLDKNKLSDITKFSVVRFGNIFSSRGSVAHIFNNLIENNEKIKITDLNMTRYTTTPELAAFHIMHLPLFMRGGEIYVPKLSSYNILQLGKLFYKCKKKYTIEYINNNFKDLFEIIGIRPGEKIHEDYIDKSELYKIWEANCFYVFIPNTLIDNHYQNVEKYYNSQLSNIVIEKICSFNSKVISDETLEWCINNFIEGKID